jgi:hypothetical protein
MAQMVYEPAHPTATRITERAEAFSGTGLPLPRIPRISISKEEGVAPLQVKISKSRILRIDGKVLIVEFEVPVDGLMLPGDAMRVYVSDLDGSLCNARVIGGQSSHRGPHGDGLTVRLALKLEGRASWDQGCVKIQWRGQIQSSAGERKEVVVDVELRLNKEA